MGPPKYVQGTEVNTLPALAHSILTTTRGGRKHYYYSHFTDQEIEGQRGKVTPQGQRARSQSKQNWNTARKPCVLRDFSHLFFVDFLMSTNIRQAVSYQFILWFVFNSESGIQSEPDEHHIRLTMYYMFLIITLDHYKRGVVINSILK